jgi:hypothetical protein
LLPTVFPDISGTADSRDSLNLRVRELNLLDDALFANVQSQFDDRMARSKLDIEEKVKDMECLMLAKEIRAETTKVGAC